MDYEKLCRNWGKLFRAEIGEKEESQLKDSLEFLGIDATPEETQSLARAAGVLGVAAGLLMVFVLSLLLGFSILWLLFAAFPVLLYFYLKKYPTLKAESEKKRAVGEMPEMMSYLIMSLRISPNLEKAVEFAACHSRGLFKKKLGGIISNVRAGRGDAELDLLKLADEFKRWDELKRSIQLVISSILERTEDRRQKTLDAATEALLGGLASRTEKEARALNTPVMIVFTFGVILPLIFVAIIPFMSLMGLKIGVSSVAVMYTIGLPLFLYFLIKFISGSRPITMAAPSVPAEKVRGKALLAAAVAGILLLAPIMLGEKTLGAMRYVPVLWCFGASAGIFLLMTTIKTKRLRKKTKDLEKGFAETLHQLGVVLSEGRPLEDAMQSVDSQFLKGAARNIQSLNTDLRSAFFDNRYGSLREAYSDTIRGVADILVSISNKGSEAVAKTAFRMSEHINNLKKSEAEIERALGGVVSSMRIIALVVAPLVGGMISSMSVVLAKTMAKSQGAKMGFAGKAEAMDPSLVTLIIGIYAIESAAILMVFGTELMNGDDKVMKKYNIGLALPISITVFTICAFVANGLFGGIS